MVRIEIEKKIAILNLNRPPVNALNSEMVEQLHQAAIELREKSFTAGVRAVIIQSAGKHFCAGADLKERRLLAQEKIARTVLKIQQAFTAMARTPVPGVAAITGSAIGGGLELALAADLRFASENARLGLRETALAILPGSGGTQRLSRLIGAAAAIYWIGTAKIFSADEALNWGVLQGIVPGKLLSDHAYNVAAEFAANAPVAVRAAKRAILQGFEQPLGTALATELEFYKTTIETKDRTEALNAFFEKRKPEFRGE